MKRRGEKKFWVHEKLNTCEHSYIYRQSHGTYTRQIWKKKKMPLKVSSSREMLSSVGKLRHVRHALLWRCEERSAGSQNDVISDESDLSSCGERNFSTFSMMDNILMTDQIDRLKVDIWYFLETHANDKFELYTSSRDTTNCSVSK